MTSPLYSLSLDSVAGLSIEETKKVLQNVKDFTSQVELALKLKEQAAVTLQFDNRCWIEYHAQQVILRTTSLSPNKRVVKLNTFTVYPQHVTDEEGDVLSSFGKVMLLATLKKSVQVGDNTHLSTGAAKMYALSEGLRADASLWGRGVGKEIDNNTHGVFVETLLDCAISLRRQLATLTDHIKDWYGLVDAALIDNKINP